MRAVLLESAHTAENFLETKSYSVTLVKITRLAGPRQRTLCYCRCEREHPAYYRTIGPGTPLKARPSPESRNIALGRVAVLALISPMRTEGDDPVRFDALPPTQYLLHQGAHVVVAQSAKHPAEVIEACSCPSNNAYCVAWV